MFLIIDLSVKPNSNEQKIILDKSGIIKVFLKSLPEKNKANNELIEYLAKLLNITQNEIEILSGFSSRKKRLKILKNINYEEFVNLLGFDNQLKI